ncbi:helix-turn-helix domain-containing protein [Helicobacter sp. T3_23-1059]
MSENLGQMIRTHKSDLLKAHCSLYQAYKNLFSNSGSIINEQINPNGIAKLEFIGDNYAIKCSLINVLDGISLHYGSYEGDFSALKYHSSKPSLHFGLLQSGDYEGMLDKKPFSVKQNEVFLIAPDTHTMGSSAKAKCNCIQIDIDIQESKRDLQAFLPNFSIEAFYDFIAQNPLVATSCFSASSLLNGLCEIKNIDLLRLKVLESLLTMWQSAINLATKSERVANMSEATYSKGAYILRVAEYLQTNYNATQEELNLRALSEQFSVCVSKLTSDFREVKGISLYQFIKQCKIKNACEMLKNGKSVSQVANEVGYINVSCFCKNFKECYGISPNEFKKNAK